MDQSSDHEPVAVATAGNEPPFHTYVRRESAQLFFLFTGYGQELNVNPVEFVHKTGIADRNIVILRDPFYAGYHHGISDEYNSLHAIVEWQRALLEDTFPHVREVFCAGTSSGGPPAMYTGHHLGARAVWSLAGRAATADLIQDRHRAAHELHMRVLGRPKGAVPTPLEVQKIKDSMNDPEVLRIQARLMGNPDTILDMTQIAGLVALLQNSSRTRFHLYYSVSNAIDRRFAESFRDCPPASLHPVTPVPRDRSGVPLPSFTDRDHGIVVVLAERGELHTLFSEYLSPAEH